MGVIKLLRIAVYPNTQNATEIEDALFNHLRESFKQNMMNEIFLNFKGKELEICYQEEVDENDSEFRIDTTLPFSFRGTVVISINAEQFTNDDEKDNFLSELIKNIHYY